MGDTFELKETNIFRIEEEPTIVAIDKGETTDGSAGDLEYTWVSVNKLHLQNINYWILPRTEVPL